MYISCVSRRTHKLFGPVNPGTTSRLSQGHLDVNQSKKFMFMCLFSPGNSDLFSRRFREGNSFPNLALPELCAVHFALQNRALFERKKGEKVVREGDEEGWPRREKRTRENKSECLFL